MSNKVFIAGIGGRICSCMLRAMAVNNTLSNVVGVSASGNKDLSEVAEKLDHDSTHRRFPLEVRHLDCDEKNKINESHIGFLTFRDENSRDPLSLLKVPVFAEPDASKLPLKELDVDVSVDSTGKYLTKEKASAFLKAGAKKVIMSAPPKDDTPMVIYHINGEEDKGLDIVSTASCTTNCAAPIVKALSDAFETPIRIILTTTHAVTNSQRLLDGSSKKMANSYAGLNNIVVSSTGATKALKKMFPKIKTSDGLSCRVPVVDGSVLSLTLEFKRDIKNLTTKTVLKALEDFPDEYLRVSHRKTMISSYIVGRSEPCIVAPGQIYVDGDIVRVVAGYDNEYSYAYHLALAALNAPLPKK